MLCRDRCGYCTFAKAPARVTSPYLSLDEVLDIARRGRPGGLSRSPVHPRGRTRGPVPGGPAMARRTRVRVDRRLPCRRLPCGGRSNRPPPARQCRRPRQRGPRAAARGDRQSGDDARVAQPGPGGAPPRTGQDARAAPRHPRGRRRTVHPLHHRSAGRHRRIAYRSSRHAAGDRGEPSTSRPRPGSHRPELPPETRHRDASVAPVPDRRVPLDRRGRTDAPATRGPPAGTAQSLRRPRHAPRVGDRRLGWRLAGHRRPREPRARMARPRAPAC